MIEELKPYESYRAATGGLPPLPAHWHVRRTKSLLKEIDRRTKTGTERLLSLRMNIGLVDHHAMGGKLIPPSSLVGYKHVLPGELVMNRMRAAVGLFGAASSEGLVSPDYAIYNVRPELRVEYAVSLFKTPTMTSLFRLESRGLGTGESGFLRLYSDRFGVLPMPLPGPEEQAVIVRFLEHANRRIDQFIRAKKKLITLLNEQKQAIVHRAVTRGLDPKVKVKNSGIPWLGEIPAHWEVRRLKYVASLQRGYDLPSDSRVAGPYPVVSSGGLIDTHHEFRSEGPGVVLGRYGSTEAVFYVEPSFWPHNTSLFVTNFHGNNRRWAYYLLRSISKGAHSGKSAVPGVDRKDLHEIVVPVPPRPEQEKLVAALPGMVADVGSRIQSLERELELGREYRTRLISDLVTGQLDVRAAAASLPELEPKVELAEPSDDEEADIDDSEAA